MISALVPAVVLTVAAQSAVAQALPSWGEAARRCLDGDTGAFVTRRRTQGTDVTTLLVHRRDGLTEQCLFVPDGRIALSLVPDARPPREDEPAFFLDRHCADARPVTDGQGRGIGWFAYPACRR